MSRAAAALLLAALGSGCGDNLVDPCDGQPRVCVGVHLGTNVTPLDRIRVTLDRRAGDGMLTPPAPGGPLDFPVRFAIHLPDGTAHAHLDFDGLSAGDVHATVATDVDIPASGRTTVSLTLGAAGPSDGGGATDFATQDLAGLDFAGLDFANPPDSLPPPDLRNGCGNHVLDPHEACDDGVLNGQVGDGCDSQCRIIAGAYEDYDVAGDGTLFAVRRELLGAGSDRMEANCAQPGTPFGSWTDIDVGATYGHASMVASRDGTRALASYVVYSSAANPQSGSVYSMLLSTACGFVKQFRWPTPIFQDTFGAAMLTGGGFVILWADYTGNDHDIAFYDRNGVQLGSSLPLGGNATNCAGDPTVAATIAVNATNGNGVVVCENPGGGYLGYRRFNYGSTAWTDGALVQVVGAVEANQGLAAGVADDGSFGIEWLASPGHQFTIDFYDSTGAPLTEATLTSGTVAVNSLPRLHATVEQTSSVSTRFFAYDNLSPMTISLLSPTGAGMSETRSTASYQSGSLRSGGNLAAFLSTGSAIARDPLGF